MREARAGREVVALEEERPSKNANLYTNQPRSGRMLLIAPATLNRCPKNPISTLSASATTFLLEATINYSALAGTGPNRGQEGLRSRSMHIDTSIHTSTTGGRVDWNDGGLGLLGLRYL